MSTSRKTQMATGGLRWLDTDAGRSKSAWPHVTHDCGVRAIAGVMDLSYAEARQRIESTFSGRTNEHVERAIRRTTLSRLLGRDWYYDTQLLDGRRRRFRREDLPLDERIIVYMHNHFSAVVNGEIRDEWDPSGPNVIVYGILRRRPV